MIILLVQEVIAPKSLFRPKCGPPAGGDRDALASLLEAAAAAASRFLHISNTSTHEKADLAASTRRSS